jgi:ankyrin repeat protein
MASLILDYGADINAENKKGTTALDYCDNYHFDKLGDWFVQNGGDNGPTNIKV